MKKLLFAFPIVALLAAGCSSSQQTPVSQNTGIVSPQYKNFSQLGFIRAEIPGTWSVSYHTENYLKLDSTGEYALSPANAIASIGQDYILFGDTAWNEIDMYGSQDDISNSLITQEKKIYQTGTWSKETISGITADVLTESLDNGQVTKDETGGKIYVLNLPQNTMGIKTLVIAKQALGGNEFESGFKHFLETVKF